MGIGDTAGSNKIGLGYARLAAVLVAVFLVLAFCGCGQQGGGRTEAEIRAERVEKIVDEIEAATGELQAEISTGDTFEYKGEEYSFMSAMAVANDEFWGTEDYYPFCDAYYAASIAKSARVGEVYLKYVAAYNKYAVEYGYANYYEMARADFGYDFSTTQLLSVVKTYYPQTVDLLHYYTGVLNGAEQDVDFDKAAVTAAVCGAYGRIKPEYETALRTLLDSDRYSDETTADASISNGYVNTYSNSESGEKTVSLHLLYGDAVTYAMLLDHEFGHYLHAVNTPIEAERFLALSETHSIGGFVLTLDGVEAHFKSVYGEREAAFMALCALVKQLSFLFQATAANVLEEDVFTNPQNYTGADFARRYHEINEELGIECGYSEAYALLMGSDWYDSFGGNLAAPFYKLSYAVGSINAIWLAKRQSDDGSGYGVYRKTIETPLVSDNYRGACAEVGLPYILDASMHQGLDDYFSAVLNARIDAVLAE